MTSKSLRVNEQIRIPQVRLIDQDDRQVGIVSTVEALSMARAVGLDLVEVAPGSAPPVCRIMDFGKWKYMQKKKDHRAKVKQHQVVLKEIRLRPKIEDHDKQVKIRKAREFLTHHSKVQFTMLFRGREMAHKALAETLFNEIVEQLQDVGRPESPARYQGRRMMMVMAAGAAGKKGPADKRSDAPQGGLALPPIAPASEPTPAVPDAQPVVMHDAEPGDDNTENE